MIDTRIFKEKFVFITVDIALFIPIQSLAQFFVPVIDKRIVFQLELRVLSRNNWWPHRHQRKWRNMLQVNRHVIENFNLYILQEIISVISQIEDRQV